MLVSIWFPLTLGVIILIDVCVVQYLSGGKVLRELNCASVDLVRFNSWENKYELTLMKDNHNHKFYLSRQHFMLLEVGYVVSVKYDDNFYVQEVKYAIV